MNITLSIDERLASRARKVAKSMGKSLNQIIREHLEDLTSKRSSDAWIAEIRRLSDLGHGRSGGHRFNREEAHARRP